MNDLRKEVVFADIKLAPSRTNLKALKEKSSKLSEEYKGYKKEWLGLHKENIREFLIASRLKKSTSRPTFRTPSFSRYFCLLDMDANGLNRTSSFI